METWGRVQDWAARMMEGRVDGAMIGAVAIAVISLLLIAFVRALGLRALPDSPSNASNAAALSADESDPLGAALRACRQHFIAVLSFSAALNLLYLAPSLYMLQVYDRVLTSRGVLTLVFLTLVLLASLAALAFLDAIRLRLLALAARRIDRLATPFVLRAALQKEARAAAGSAQPLREFDAFRLSLTGAPALAIVDAPWAPVYVAVCFLLHPSIGVLVTLGGIGLITLALLNGQALRRPLGAHDEGGADLYALQNGDSAQGEVARALGMRQAIVARQLRARAAMAEAQLSAGRIGSGFTASTRFLRLALQSATLGLGAYLAINHELTPGGVIAASILAARAFAPIEQIVAAWRQLGQGVRGQRIVKAVLAAAASDRAHTRLPDPQGDILVAQASVRGPERFILRDASLHIAPAEIVGVIGPSGSGKSTLVRLLAGAIAPDEGVVRLDGAKLSDWEPDRLGRHIGYLPQDVGLFAGTIAANIARFEEAPDADARVIAAAEAAGVHDMILRLPQGYDTRVGPNGRGLSAGQAQRVALARALYRDPAVLVLDEPNAHVDAEGEAALVNALKAAQARGASIVVVAHRAGFMSIADKLLLLREGRIDAFGPRDQVMTRLAAAGAPRPAVAPAAGAQPS